MRLNTILTSSIRCTQGTMTQEAKLQKIIEKGKERGWESNVISVNIGYEYQVLFDHSLAKAIWGEEKVTGLIGDEYYEYPNWQHHLQQAVISDDPIDYYYKNM